jgi:Tfp pilus assembly pilus retraction ATPase PilT
MIEQDTIKLLRECDAGVKMGVASIDDVLEYVGSDKLMQLLSTCKDAHESLNTQIQQLLDQYKDEGKNPNPIAKSMSWMKTNLKLAVNESDHTIADLITDGCNMGVKTLNRYLNQYQAADEVSKDIAKKLINLEEKLAVDIRGFL